jgi:hypothetical protein
MFVDNRGRVHVFEGNAASGAAEFQGPGHGQDGHDVLNRIRVLRIDDRRVSQLWEKSTDNGVTWSTEFRGDYARQRP